MDEQIEKVITISDIIIKPHQTKGSRVAIKDEKNLTYSFFEAKADGDTSKAYAWFHENNPQVGESVKFTYKESEGEWQGKKVTYRNIMWFDSKINNTLPEPTNKPNNGFTESREDYGRRLAIHGMVNGLLANPNYDPAKVKVSLPEIFALEDAIEDQLKQRNGQPDLISSARQAMQKGLDKQQGVEEINVDEVPF